MAAPKLVVEFKLEKETKGTFRYEEVTDGEEVIGSLYIKKPAAAVMGNPATLTITIVGG